MQILVIEDEEQIADLLQAALESLGVSSRVAASAEDADRLLQEHEVDAVTLDLGMPDRSGLDWLESVAASHPELARKTIVITGQHLESEAIERLASCGAGLLAKPFTISGLSDAIRTQIAHHDSSRRPLD
jgi:DNA-binding response OmpR family regulator